MPGNGEAVPLRTEARRGEGSAFVLSRGVVMLFAVACGVAVANVYFSQPLLVTMGQDLAMSPALVGSVVTLTQVGYGLGLFFLVPLGDVADRRRLIVAQLLLLVPALAVAAAAHTAAILLAGMAATGLLAVVTQTLVAFAASLAPPAGRGRVVGLVTSGVVIGILLARTASGLMAVLAGWRSGTSPRRRSPLCSRWSCTECCRATVTLVRQPCATDSSCAPRSPCSHGNDCSGSGPCSVC